jgi:molecular chaperone GrpE
MKPRSKEKTKEQQAPEIKKGELEELRTRAETLQAEKDEVFEKLQRVRADYANFEKRVSKQIADTISYEKEKIIKTLLPALDNFDHTLQNASSAESPDVLIKGVRIIYDQMLDMLKSHGVEQIEALGEEFDPAVHEAMMRRTEPEQEENIVVEEFQKGYKLNGRVIRPTKAIISAPPSEQDEQQTSTQEAPDTE